MDFGKQPSSCSSMSSTILINLLYFSCYTPCFTFASPFPYNSCLHNLGLIWIFMLTTFGNLPRRTRSFVTGDATGWVIFHLAESPDLPNRVDCSTFSGFTKFLDTATSFFWYIQDFEIGLWNLLCPFVQLNIVCYLQDLSRIARVTSCPHALANTSHCIHFTVQEPRR